MFETVFERASESLLHTIRAALDESNRLNNRWVCSEHLMLALARDNKSIAGQALATMKLDPNSLRAEVEKELKEKMASEPIWVDRVDSSEQESADKPRLSVF
ncbi:MAG: Clp protease N-terminal domain-containing protein, partial [Terriglobales bacterium]